MGECPSLVRLQQARPSAFACLLRLSDLIFLILAEVFDPDRTHLWGHPGWHGLGIDVRLCSGVVRSVSGGTSLSASEPTPDCRSAPYAALPGLSDRHANMVN